MKRLLLLLLAPYIFILFLLSGKLLYWYSNSYQNRSVENEVVWLKGKLKEQPRHYAARNLNFVPNINFDGKKILHRDSLINYFNAAGYRGDIVPIQRDSQKIRILFLGGSTTFLESGVSIESTLPGSVHATLCKSLDIDCNNIEIINGALDGANSFDLLNFYLYKYKYYKPDILVIHSGFNDCAWYADDIYSSDYTHLNISMQSQNISKTTRIFAHTMLQTKLTSWILTTFFVNNQYSAKKMMKQAKKERQDFPKWNNLTPSSVLNDEENNAFYNNIQILTKLAVANKTLPILVQMPYPKGNIYYQGVFGDAIHAHNQFLKQISMEEGVHLITLEDLNIPESCFTDVIHVDSIGNYLKGKAVVNKILQNL